MRSVKGGGGFSLIEVTLSILLIGIGLLSLFSLFPMALQESELAITDTQEAMFADHVLNGIEGNAMAITNWTEWTMSGNLIEGIYPLETEGMSVSAHNTYVDFPEPGSGAEARPLRYRLNITPLSGRPERKSVRLEVKSGRYGVFTNAAVFYTELVFMGM